MDNHVKLWELRHIVTTFFVTLYSFVTNIRFFVTKILIGTTTYNRWDALIFCHNYNTNCDNVEFVIKTLSLLIN